MFCLLLVSGLLSPGLATAQQAAPHTAPPPAAVGKQADDDQRLICKTEKSTGSNLPRRVCLTAAERKARQLEAQRTLSTIQHRQNAGGMKTGG
jgi:hypothetical protein